MLMILLLGVTVESRHHKGFDGVEANIILNHEIDKVFPMNAEQDQNLHQLFNNIDQDKDRKISYDEAVEFIAPNLFEYGSLFDILDLNENNILEYDEVTFAFTSDLFGASNDNSKAESLAKILFDDIDINDDTHIQSQEFVDFYVHQEWMQFVDHPDSMHITFSQFRNNVFNSLAFKIFKDLHSESKEYSNRLDEHLKKCQESHKKMDNTLTSSSDGIEGSIEHNLVHKYIRILASTIASERRRLFCRRRLPGQRRRLLCWNGDENTDTNCYDQYDVVHELNTGSKYIRDISVGDYVFDGQDYTKVYFIQTYDQYHTTTMLEIKYGNPTEENSISLTSEHMVYKYDHDEPIISGDIKIGDELNGNNMNKDNNYTVYSIQIVTNKHPINPITVSGKLMVNNIITSVFSHSALEGKRLHESAAIFRWISDHIHEQLAVTLIDFYYNIIYKRIIKQNEYIHQLLMQSHTFAMVIVVSVPALIVILFNKYIGNGKFTFFTF